MSRSLAISAASLWVCSACWAAPQPVPVSPGSATGSVIGVTCPTFSWSAAEGAESYDLAIYRLADDREDEELVLRVSFAGSVYSWTPALGQCLEPGGLYAWSVRATGEVASEWSPPSLFEVDLGPSDVELERALAVVQRYLAKRGHPADGGSERPAPSATLTPQANPVVDATAIATRQVGSASFESSGPSAAAGSPSWPLTIIEPQAVTYLESTANANGSVVELKSSAPTPTFLGAINFNNAASTFPGQIAYEADHEMTFRTNGVERLRIDTSGSVTNPLALNGLVKAWARINSNGTIQSCWRCNADGTEKVLTGRYNVNFSPLGSDIHGRPVFCSASLQKINATCNTLASFSLVFLVTTDVATGAEKDTEFTVVVF